MVGGQIVVDERRRVIHIQPAVENGREQVRDVGVLVGPQVGEESVANGVQALLPESRGAGGRGSRGESGGQGFGRDGVEVAQEGGQIGGEAVLRRRGQAEQVVAVERAAGQQAVGDEIETFIRDKGGDRQFDITYDHRQQPRFLGQAGPRFGRPREAAHPVIDDQHKVVEAIRVSAIGTAAQVGVPGIDAVEAAGDFHEGIIPADRTGAGYLPHPCASEVC